MEGLGRDMTKASHHKVHPGESKDFSPARGGLEMTIRHRWGLELFAQMSFRPKGEILNEQDILCIPASQLE